MIDLGGLGTNAGVYPNAINAVTTWNSEPAEIFRFAIDWDSDGTIDETVTGPSGTTVDHAFPVAGNVTASVTATVYSYDVTSDTWSTIAPLPIAVENGAAILGADGLVYMLGGETASGESKQTHVYNPSTGTWLVGPEMSNARSDHAVTLTFNTIVNISDPFRFVNATTGHDVIDAPVISIIGTKTLVEFAFTPGESVDASGSLLDGNYHLTVDAAMLSIPLYRSASSRVIRLMVVALATPEFGRLVDSTSAARRDAFAIGERATRRPRKIGSGERTHPE